MLNVMEVRASARALSLRFASAYLPVESSKVAACAVLVSPGAGRIVVERDRTAPAMRGRSQARLILLVVFMRVLAFQVLGSHVGYPPGS